MVKLSEDSLAEVVRVRLVCAPKHRCKDLHAHSINLKLLFGRIEILGKSFGIIASLVPCDNPLDVIVQGLCLHEEVDVGVIAK